MKEKLKINLTMSDSILNYIKYVVMIENECENFISSPNVEK